MASGKSIVAGNFGWALKRVVKEQDIEFVLLSKYAESKSEVWDKCIEELGDHELSREVNIRRMRKAGFRIVRAAIQET